MSLTVSHIGGFNPFEFEHFACPLCGSKKFTSISHAGVYCDECNVSFVVRDTAGDPGCVVDCFLTKDKGSYIYAPKYQCSKCDANAALFPWQDLTCPVNMNHGSMVVEDRIRMPWKHPHGMEYLYMIMKTQDYCSGWLPHSKQFPGPTSKQWQEFCDSL